MVFEQQVCLDIFSQNQRFTQSNQIQVILLFLLSHPQKDISITKFNISNIKEKFLRFQKFNVEIVAQVIFNSSTSNYWLNVIRWTIDQYALWRSQRWIWNQPKEIFQERNRNMNEKIYSWVVKKNFIGAAIDVPRPDLGTGEQKMSWMKDAYTKFKGHQDLSSVGCVTGKAITQGGISGRQESTGMGKFQIIPSFVNLQVMNQVQNENPFFLGYGNVGSLESPNMRSIFNPNGINPYELAAHKTKTEGVKGFANAEQYWEDESAIYKQCDIFIPAAFEKTVNESNAKKFNCKIIAECANGPWQLKKNFLPKNYLFTRYFLNASGVTVSYLEWLKNLKHINPGRMTRRWEEQAKHRIYEQVSQKNVRRPFRSNFLLQILFRLIQFTQIEAVNNIMATSLQYKVNLRLAVYISAINKLNEHFEMAGVEA
ncbi:unnamed protein product [Paramecium sonneborni]|uniref:Glutamate/phenylalanine/leucine/valine/L-tryptophan dehydrogenase C-terminal domain-containing protein n=1 Tax=Paramecium sonneborni TaxID=65129 RepID=A0A8S1RQ13_9CILI|nr:unnamed protein product [Paramecium sonneborni]